MMGPLCGESIRSVWVLSPCQHLMWLANPWNWIPLPSWKFTLVEILEISGILSLLNLTYALALSPLPFWLTYRTDADMTVSLVC